MSTVGGPPTPLRPTLLRPRLVAILRRRWELRLLGVVAGAGFGKTTCLVHAVEENRLDPLGEDLYHRCTSEDTEATVLGAALCEMLGGRRSRSTSRRSITSAIVEACIERAPVPVAIMLDDLHLLEPSGTGVELLGEVLEGLPQNAHLIAVSRQPLPLPVAHLTSRGEALCIGERQLAFDPDEVRGFADLREVPTDRMDKHATWPALAELTASAAGVSVSEYLWEQLLGTFPAGRRRDLAIVAAVGGGNLPTLTAALDREVDPKNLFSDLPLASATDLGEFSLHPLWEAPLAGEISATERSEALVRVGNLLARQGEVLRAFEVLSKAEAWPEVRTLVVRACASLRPPPAEVLLRWHAALPPRLRHEPEGRLLEGVVRKQRELDPLVALEPLVTLGESFRQCGDLRGEFACLNHAMQIGFWCGLPDVISDCLGRANELTPDVPAAEALVAIGPAFLATANGKSREVLAAIDRARSSITSEPTYQVTTQLEAESLMGVGRPHEAVMKAELLAPAPAADTLVAALWMAGRVDDALDHIRDVQALLRDLPLRQLQAVTAQAGRMLAYAGRRDEAAAMLATCAAAGEPGTQVVDVRMSVADAALALASGEERRALEILEDLFERRPLSDARIARAARRAVALPYVLLPETRTFWDGDLEDRCWDVPRSLLQAFVAAREHGDLDAIKALSWPQVDVVRSWLPGPWVAELGVACVAAGAGPGQELVSSLGRHGRFELRRVLTGDGPLAASARRALDELALPPPFELEVKVIGPLEVCRDGVPIDSPDLRRERVRQLLCYLVAHRRVSREQVMTALWPDHEREAAANNLRVTLSYLSRALEPDRSAGEPAHFIRQGPIWLELASDDGLVIDVDRFEAARHRATILERDGVPSLAGDSYREAARLWRGEYLSDVKAGWAEHEQERFRATWATTALRAGELALAAGTHDRAEQAAMDVLSVEPWSERAYALMLAVHLDQGDRAMAMRTAERCEAMLHELGVSASPETRMLLGHLRSP